MFMLSGSVHGLSNHMDYSTPGSSVHAIFQARILEWTAISYSRGSSWPRAWTRISCVSCMAGKFFTTEPPLIMHSKKVSTQPLYNYTWLPWWLSSKEFTPAMQETQEMWVQSLGQEDPLEKERATHSSILPGKSYEQRSYSPWAHKSQTQLSD